MAETYKKLTYGSKKIQVESAIRDGDGAKISTNYVKKSTVSVPSTVPTASWGGTATIGSVDGKDFKITMMSNPNTDASVLQYGNNTNDEHYILVKNSNTSASGNETNKVQWSASAKMNLSTGIITAGGFNGTQVGGISKTYTSGANTNRVVLARVNNYAGIASCRIKLEVGPDSSSGAKVVYIDAVWAGRGHALTIESVYDWNNAIRYFFCVVPNNTSYYTSNPPEIHIQQNSAVARTIKATIIERSGDVVLMDNLTTTGNTTNRNTRTYDVNNTIGVYDNTGYVQNSGWAAGAWDRLDNDHYLYGEACVNLSLVARATDGKLWKVSRTDKEFLLPLDFGNCTGTFAAGANWGRVCRTIRGLGYANFTNTTAQTTAFTVPTLTTSDYGKTIYLVGTLNNGNFVSSRKITLSMETPSSGSLTYIPIGKIDRSDQNVSTTAPSTWTLDGYNANAFTIDSNGKLTHVNGKEIKDTTYSSLAAASSGTAVSLVTTGEKYTWNNKASTAVVSKTANGLCPQLPNETTTTKFLRQDGSWAVPSYIADTDCKTSSANKASTKLFLIGAETQSSANNIGATTQSNVNCYVGTDNCLYSNGTKVLTSHQDISGKQDKIGAGTKGQFLMASGTAGTVGFYTLETTGNGNAVTAVAVDTTNSKITVTKGATYNNYSLPLAASGTRGGVQIGYSESGTNYAVKLSSEKMYVTVPWTDTQVTSVDKHYAPSADTSAALSASASGATAAWSIDVVKAVQLQRDAKGHVTGVTVTSGKIPANPNTDTKVTETVSTTDNWYPILASPTANATTTATTTSIFASGIKLNPAKTGIIGTQFGGQSKTYEIQATGYKTILQMKDAATYWTTNGGHSFVRYLIEYSTIAPGTIGTTGMKSGSFIVDSVFSGVNGGHRITSMNANAGTTTGVMRYFRAFSPKSTSYCPQICVALQDATTKVYVTVTILSASEGWQLPSTIGGDPGTTNYNQWSAEIGRYNYGWESVKLATNITGSCDGTAGNTWDSIKNDRFYTGASAVWYHKNSSNTVTQYAIVNTRPFGTASDGKVYHLSTPDKAFMLPFTGGRALANYELNSTSATPWMMVRGIVNTELTNTNVANNANLSASTTYTGTGTAYAYNWVIRTHTNSTTWTDATTFTIGKNMYICGNLDASGNFVPYYTSATGQTISVPSGQGGFTAATNVTMQKYTFYITQNPTYTANYNTFLLFAKADKDTTHFSYWTLGATAYTYNSDGKLTHIDGKGVAESGNMKYTDQSVSFTANSDAYSTDYPYRATLTSPGTTAASYATATYSGAQVASGNYAPFCRTDAGVVYLYAKTNVGTQIIPTISVGTDSTDLTRQPISADIVSRTLTLVSSSNTEVSGYPYKYSFPCAGASAQSTADVTFGSADATSGVWAPICDTGADVIYIYAKSAQSSCSAGYQLYYSDSAVTLTPAGNVGNDTKPVKIVGGQVEAVSTDLAKLSSTNIGSNTRAVKVVNGQIEATAHDFISLDSGSNAGSIPTWGTLTAARGFSHSWGINHSGGGLEAATNSDSGGQTSLQIDGYFFQDEGAWRCIAVPNSEACRRLICGIVYRENDYKTQAVSFGATYSNYILMVTPIGGNTSAPSNGWKVYDTSTTGFRIYMDAGSSTITSFYWMALVGWSPPPGF